jgi:DNA mismatch endonuclease, patch repair protein
MAVRKQLWSLGARFRVHARDLPGSPDIVNRSGKWAVFVHGCFWHRHSGCSRTTTPNRNRAFWLKKFRANQLRDARAHKRLLAAGFVVLTVWECECGDLGKLAHQLKRFLSGVERSNRGRTKAATTSRRR